MGRNESRKECEHECGQTIERGAVTCGGGRHYWRSLLGGRKMGAASAEKGGSFAIGHTGSEGGLRAGWWANGRRVDQRASLPRGVRRGRKHFDEGHRVRFFYGPCAGGR